MPEKPVAKLALDTRAHGPYVCDNCEAENEDAILMTDATVVCPECKEPLEAFQQFSEAIVSVTPVAVKAGKKRRWVIKFMGPDSSSESTDAYDSQEEAIDVAVGWIKSTAEGELNDFEWDEGDEAPEKLRSILAHIQKRELIEAISEWLDYQEESDPQEKIAIGPSGSVSTNAGDFDYSVAR